MRTPLLALLCAALLTTGCSDEEPVVEAPPSDDARPHPATRRARLVVATTAPEVVVVDVEFAEERGRFTLDREVASVVPGYSGSLAALVTDDGVQFVSGGVAVTDHTGEGWEGSEHIHLYKLAPQLLDFAPGPATSVSSFGDRWAAAGTGMAMAFDEAPLIQNDTPEATQVDDAALIPDLAVPTPEGLIAHVGPDLVWFDHAGVEQQRFSGCTIAGEAWPSASHLVVPCAEGWAVLPLSGQTAGEIVSYAHGSEAPAHAVGHIDAARVGARVGDTFTWVEPASATTGTVPLPAGSCDVAFDSELGERLVVLDDGGRVHLLDAATGGAARPATSASDAFDCDGALRPHLATVPRLAFVSRPTRDDVVELDVETGVERQVHAVGAPPAGLAVLGVDPRNRNAGTCATCR